MDFGKYYDVGVRAACLVVALLFIIRYSRVNWRATSDGKHIMAFTAMIASFLVLILATYIFGREWWIIWAGRALFVWALFLLIQRIYLQKKAQEELDADKPEDNHPSASNKQRKEDDLDKGILEGNSGTSS